MQIFSENFQAGNQLWRSSVILNSLNDSDPIELLKMMKSH